MMKRLLPNASVLLWPALLALASCAASAPAASTSSTRPATTRRTPAEDLSKYRPVFPPPAPAPEAAAATAKKVVAPTNQLNVQAEQRLRDVAYQNQSVKYAAGYRILAYVGLERERAMTVRRAIIGRYPDETDYLTFKQPIYRLAIGDYLTRLEAEQALQRLLPLAPKAELQPAQVLLNH